MKGREEEMMKKRVGIVMAMVMLVTNSLSAFATSPSPTATTEEVVTSDIVIVTEKTTEEITQEKEVVIETMVASGDLDESGTLTAQGVATVAEMLLSVVKTENAQVLDSGLVTQLTESGEEVGAVLFSLTGEILATISTDSIIVTNTDNKTIEVVDGVAAKPVITGLSEAATAQMDQAITKIFGDTDTIAEADLSTAVHALVQEIPTLTLPESATLQVTNIVDIDLSDSAKQAQELYGAQVAVTVSLDVDQDHYVIALHNYSDDNWENIPCVNNGDGTVTVAMSSQSPVVFVVSDEEAVIEVASAEDTTEEAVTEEADTTDDTADVTEEADDAATEVAESSSNMMYIIVVVLLIAGILFIVFKKKNKKTDEK